MLSGDSLVLNRHLKAGKGHHLGTGSHVEIVKRGFYRFLGHLLERNKRE
jgi:hypothetical protein